MRRAIRTSVLAEIANGLPVGGVALALSCAVACASPRTALVVVVDSDLDVPAALASVHADTGSGAHDFDLTAASARVPFSFGVEPVGGDASREVTLVIEGRDASGATVVTRRVRAGFSAGRTLVLRVRLDGACVGVPCGDGTTCALGSCIDDRIDPTTLPELIAGHELDPFDAGTVDDGSFDADDAEPLDVGEVAPASCRDLPAGSPTGPYTIDPDGDGGQPAYLAFCDSAEGGGWTLVAKVDASTTELAFGALVWTALTSDGNDFGSDDTEVGNALRPSYWHLPVRELRLVMTDVAGTRSLVVPLDAAEPTTLRAAMEPGGSVGLTATLDEWTTLAGMEPLVTPTCARASAPLVSPAVRVRIGASASLDAACEPTMIWVGLGAESDDQGGSCDASLNTAGASRLCGPARGDHAAFTMLFAR